MKFFQNLIVFSSVLLAFYACQPDGLPIESTATTAVIQIDTVITTRGETQSNQSPHGDKEDETIGSHDDWSKLI